MVQIVASPLISGFVWNLIGDTGDGRCHRRCKSGHWTQLQEKLFFRYPIVVGGYNGRSPIGAFAKSHIPERLHQDLIQTAIDRSRGDGSSSRRKTVIEPFAGSTSLGTVARQKGLNYVAVDWSSLSLNSFKKLHSSDDGADLMRDYFNMTLARLLLLVDLRFISWSLFTSLLMHVVYF